MHYIVIIDISVSYPGSVIPIADGHAEALLKIIRPAAADKAVMVNL